jgi:hypothetical protein
MIEKNIFETKHVYVHVKQSENTQKIPQITRQFQF